MSMKIQMIKIEPINVKLEHLSSMERVQRRATKLMKGIEHFEL